MKDCALNAALPIAKRSWDNYNNPENLDIDRRKNANLVLGTTLIFFMECAEDEDWKEFLEILTEMKNTNA